MRPALYPIHEQGAAAFHLSPMKDQQLAVLIMCEDQLAQLHEQLNLELANLSEQKTAKVIQLLEESRRDNPLIPNRLDQEAEVMAQPANPQSVLEAIKETDAEAEEIIGGADGS